MLAFFMPCRRLAGCLLFVVIWGAGIAFGGRHLGAAEREVDAVVAPPLQWTIEPVSGVSAFSSGASQAIGQPAQGDATHLKFAFTPVGTLLGLQSSNPALYGKVTDGFTAAGAYWASQFRDPITINVALDFPALAVGTLGSTTTQSLSISYANVRTALLFDQTSATDLVATANLPVGNSLSFLTNKESNGALEIDANGTANNTVLEVPRGNAKALGFSAVGILAPNDAVRDATVSLSSNYSWDFDRSNGIAAGTYDFVGIAIHELGHTMGFSSGVDTVDFVSAPYGNAQYLGTELDSYAVFSVLDLYRYGARNGGGLDFATGGTGASNPFFSIDGGVTPLGTFATGKFNGDGRQASHWKDNLGLGILDPSFAPGELGIVTALDVQVFDAIGFDLVIVPEPAAAAFLLPAFAAALFARRAGGSRRRV